QDHPPVHGHHASRPQPRQNRIEDQLLDRRLARQPAGLDDQLGQGLEVGRGPSPVAGQEARAAELRQHPPGPPGIDRRQADPAVPAGGRPGAGGPRGPASLGPGAPPTPPRTTGPNAASKRAPTISSRSAATCSWTSPPSQRPRRAATRDRSSSKAAPTAPS